MKSLWIALLLCCHAAWLYAQAQPDRILVLTKPWADYVDPTYPEFVQELDLHTTPGSQQITCLVTHTAFCGTNYVDLSVSPKTSPTAEVLALLQKANVCSLDTLEVQQALAKARMRSLSRGGAGFTIVAECDAHPKVLEIAEWVDINEKKLGHASKRVEALFAFARLWTQAHADKESSCPAEWKQSAEQHAPELLDDFHALALEKSSAYSALRAGRIDHPPAAAYSFTVDIDRSLLEKFVEPVPTISGKTRSVALDLVAVVDGATGKIAGLEKPDLTREQGFLFLDVKRAASAWQFRPDIPTRIPFHVQFQCKP